MCQPLYDFSACQQGAIEDDARKDEGKRLNMKRQRTRRVSESNTDLSTQSLTNYRQSESAYTGTFSMFIDCRKAFDTVSCDSSGEQC